MAHRRPPRQTAPELPCRFEEIDPRCAVAGPGASTVILTDALMAALDIRAPLPNLPETENERSTELSAAEPASTNYLWTFFTIRSRQLYAKSASPSVQPATCASTRSRIRSRHTLWVRRFRGAAATSKLVHARRPQHTTTDPDLNVRFDNRR